MEQTIEYSIISPYKNTEQYTRIQVLPHMMNSDIKKNMELALVQKVENHCNRYCYVDKVYEITKYEDGIMIPEKLLGAVEYNVTYHCRICIPVENTVIIGQVKAINPEIVILHNGPIVIFIPKANIDTSIWNVSNTIKHKKDNNELTIDSFVKVYIIKKRINQGDTHIKCIGKLLDNATKEEYNKYFGNYIEKEEMENDNFII